MRRGPRASALPAAQGAARTASKGQPVKIPAPGLVCAARGPVAGRARRGGGGEGLASSLLFFAERVWKQGTNTGGGASGNAKRPWGRASCIREEISFPHNSEGLCGESDLTAARAGFAPEQASRREGAGTLEECRSNEAPRGARSAHENQRTARRHAAASSTKHQAGPVPITAAGLRGEKPLADRAMQVREVGKTAPYARKKAWL